jgi:TrmH family RNA methyltransferase
VPSTPPDPAPLGPSHRDVKELRALLRERAARDAAGRFVAEGPRLLASALDHGVAPTSCFVGPEAGADIRVVVERARAAGIEVRELAGGVAGRVGGTVTPQALFSVVSFRRRGVEVLAGDALDLVVVAAAVADPGNAGTLWRSAAAAGARAFVLGRGSVDAYNPKVVRASAGACFGVPVVEGVPAVEVLETVGARGVQRLGAVAAGGAPPEAFDVTVPTALVLGHEVHGLEADLPVDGLVTIPMAGASESLNVAMAGTVLAFEAARQRRSRAR